jgi:uncharacterized protein YbcI
MLTPPLVVSFSRREALGGRRERGRMANPPESAPERPERAALNAAISQAIVHLLAQSTGRGPTKARTTVDRDLIVVVLQNTLTPGERYLAENDRADQVLDMRAAYQEAMRSACITTIEELTDRTVSAFMSANHIDPDIAAEIFILDPETPQPTPSQPARSPAPK